MSKQVKDSTPRLDELLSFLAHEMRNPLGGIKGFAALLIEDLHDRPKLQKLAGHIMRGVDHMDEILTRILQATREPALSIEKVDIGTLIHDLKDSLSITHPNVSITIESKTVMLPCDPHLLRQALFNLLQNSVESEGNIHISIQKEGTRCVIAIADDGAGISPEDLLKIFTPFFTTKEKGFGLGLCQVQNVVKAHGGTLYLQSTQGEGTAATLTLPLGGPNEH